MELRFPSATPFRSISSSYEESVVPLEQVQVKYTTSDGRVVVVRCRSRSACVSYQYRPDHVDWIATFHATTRSISYVRSVSSSDNQRIQNESRRGDLNP